MSSLALPALYLLTGEASPVRDQNGFVVYVPSIYTLSHMHAEGLERREIIRSLLNEKVCVRTCCFLFYRGFRSEKHDITSIELARCEAAFCSLYYSPEHPALIPSLMHLGCIGSCDEEVCQSVTAAENMSAALPITRAQFRPWT